MECVKWKWLVLCSLQSVSPWRFCLPTPVVCRFSLSPPQEWVVKLCTLCIRVQAWLFLSQMAVIRPSFLLQAWFLFSSLWFLCFILFVCFFFFLPLFICLQKIIYAFTVKHSKDWTSSSRFVLYCVTNNIDSHFLWQLLHLLLFSWLLSLSPSVFLKKTEAHSLLSPLQWSPSAHHPLLSWDPVCWLKYIIGLSRFMSLCPVCCVIYVLHHTSVRRIKKASVFLAQKEKSIILLLKWNHMYLFGKKSSKKSKYPSKILRPLLQTPRVCLNVLLTISVLATY